MELPLIIWEVSSSHFRWEFKKEETQKVERTWSFCIKVKKRGRGKREEEGGRTRGRENSWPWHSSFMQICSHKFPPMHTYTPSLGSKTQMQLVWVWISNLTSYNSFSPFSLQIPVSCPQSQTLRAGEFRGHLVQLLVRCLSPLYRIVPYVGLTSYLADFSLIFSRWAHRIIKKKQNKTSYFQGKEKRGSKHILI